MRTTLTIEDDVLAAARTIADEEGTSLGAALSRLARRGLRSADRVLAHADDGLPAFEVPADAPVITAETVARALED